MTSITGNNFQSNQNISNTNSTETLINNINLQITEINDDIDQLSLLVVQNETNINNNTTRLDGVETRLDTVETDVTALETDVSNNTTSINNNTTAINILETDVNNNTLAINTLETNVTNNTTAINQLNVDTTDITYNSSTDTTTIANRLRIEAPNTVFTNSVDHTPQLQIVNSWTGLFPTQNEIRMFVSGYFGQSLTVGNKLINPGDAVLGIYNPTVDGYTGSLCICPLTHSSIKSTASGRGVRYTFTDTGDTYVFSPRHIIYRSETPGIGYVSFEANLYAKDKVTGLTIDVGDRIGLNGRNIATNTTNITDLTTRVTDCENVNTTQTTNITTNTTNISTNTSNIATNTSNIATLTTEVETLSQNYNTALSVWDDFIEPCSIGINTTGRSKFAWKNYSVTGNANTKIFTMNSERGHAGIVKLAIPSTPSFANYQNHLGLENIAYCWGDIQSIQIIYKIPLDLSSYNFKVALGISSNSSFTNSAYIYSTANQAMRVSINNGASLFTSTKFFFNIGNWSMLTITNTGSGNCQFVITQPQNDIPANRDTYNYTGGALSSTALVSPWASIYEVSGNLFPKELLIDYIKITSISDRRN